MYGTPDEGPTSVVVKQPETRPISQEQLVAEVKRIYDGLVMVESKCIEVDNARNAQQDLEDVYERVVIPGIVSTLEANCDCDFSIDVHSVPQLGDESVRRVIYITLPIAASTQLQELVRSELARKMPLQAQQTRLKFRLGSATKPTWWTGDPADVAHSRANQQRDFSSGRKQYFVEGFAGLNPLEAFPDSGADSCLISPGMASSLDLDVVPGTARTIHLANKKPVRSPGMVPVAWTFSGETTAHIWECWVLPGCLHPLVLGRKFLRDTQTLTKCISRIKSRLVSLPKRLGLRLLGAEKQRLWGYLDGNLTAALPDTGSDVMLVSSDYARKIGLNVDRGRSNWLEVEFADGSTAWTSGVARNVPWSVGGKMVHCDFHVLDNLCVDVVLSNDYLFETRVFSENSDCFFDTDSEEDLLQLCNIRLIGRFSDGLGGLEDEYLEDGENNSQLFKSLTNARTVSSLDAFSPEMVSREVARRDLIRDKIGALPQSQREAASQAELERQRRWQALREAHRLRRAAGVSGSPSSTSQEPTHRTATDAGIPRALDRPPTGEADDDDPQGQPRQVKWWKKRVNVPIPLKYLRRGGRMEE